MKGYYKAEPIRSGPWTTVEDLELAAFGSVRWHNTDRLPNYLDNVPLVEFENAFSAVPNDCKPLVGLR